MKIASFEGEGEWWKKREVEAVEELLRIEKRRPAIGFGGLRHFIGCRRCLQFGGGGGGESASEGLQGREAGMGRYPHSNCFPWLFGIKIKNLLLVVTTILTLLC